MTGKINAVMLYLLILSIKGRGKLVSLLQKVFP